MTVAELSPTGMKCEPVEKTVNKTLVRLQHGDLTALPVDAWVLYAREDLDVGSGYGTAITMRGGVSIKKELDEIGSVSMGESVITNAGEMNAKHIIHACGPKFQEADLEAKLRDCMRSSLKVASENNLKSLAYPPMGAGFYGVPLDLSAKTMFEAINAVAEGQTSLEEIIICVIDHRDYVPFKSQLDKM